MLKKIVDVSLKLKMPFLANMAVNYASKKRGDGIKIVYHKNLWLHKTDIQDIVDFTPKHIMTNKKLKWIMDEIYFKHYLPKEGDVCIDVGAGIGTESIFMSKKIGTTGVVHAIEAAQHTYNVLEENVKVNNCKNVQCHQLAISNNNESVSISSDLQGHIMNRLGTTTENGMTEVNGIRMDDFMKKIGAIKVDYLKVNIEGAEQLMIEAFETINQVKNIAISCHDFLGKRENNDWLFTRKKVTQFLLDNNFEIHSQETGLDYLDDWIYGVNKNFN